VSGGGAFAGGGAGGASANSISALPPLGHPIAPILAPWLDNHMFVASTLIGFTVMQRYPNLKVIVAHGKASWMEEVLEKMEASTRTFPLRLHSPEPIPPTSSIGAPPSGKLLLPSENLARFT